MPIQILPARLANQIAAGEVVERPASVIKELVENALDAGATRIDIDIEKGGSKLIRIRDNGCGIAKDELILALSRHATSKVSSFDDLENITSLGFRGEALASISSVARLTLTSKPPEQSEAWQAYAEGRDMVVKVIPAAHPQGTTIEVSDLFFNTPARRKFLRSDKTEFYHIDELIKRIGLSRFDVQINLTHNGKSIRQLRRALTDDEKQRRVATICSQNFVAGAVQVSCEYDGVSLFGWIATPAQCRNQNDVQFSYVNGRMMRDKLINHAIRQSYGEYIIQGQHPAYVLYLTVDPRQIDVNVHPAKHEVRFHQGRLVHDFIVQALEQAIAPKAPLLDTEQEGETFIVENDSIAVPKEPLTQAIRHQQAPKSGYDQQFKGSHYGPAKPSPNELKHYHRAMTLFTAPSELEKAQDPEDEIVQGAHVLVTKTEQSQSIAPENVALLEGSENKLGTTVLGSELGSGVCLSVINGHFALYQRLNTLFLLDLNKVNGKVAALQFSQGLVGQPLLLPVKLAMNTSDDKTILDWLAANGEFMAKLGIEYECLINAVVIRKVPAILRQQNVSERLSKIFATLAKMKGDKRLLPECLFWLYNQFGQKPEYDLSQATKLIHAAVRFEDEAQLITDCGVQISLSDHIEQLNCALIQ